LLTYLIFGVTYALAAAVQPGPLQTYIISETLSKGWRKTLPASFAPLISDGPIIILTLFILTRIPSWFLEVLHLAGAAFLFYLAYGSYKSWKNLMGKKDSNGKKDHQTLWKAALVNFLNPNPYLGWSLVMGPLFLKGYNESQIYGVILLISFYATIVAGIAGTIIVFAYARSLGTRIIRILLGLSSIGLACFGFYQLWLVIK
jgi:threonine/homoserine/homoserine lactone efflux protein